MVRSAMACGVACVVSLGIVAGCGSSYDEEPAPAPEEMAAATPNVTPKLKVVVIKDCSSLSKGGSCGSYNGVQYCNWCPSDGCDQSKCECLPNTAGTGCNGPSSGPAR